MPSHRSLLATAGGFRLLRPLRMRNFALLWSGMTISLLGDGMYTVAIAWTAYELSGAPTALSLVGLSATVPQLVLVLLGGVVSDRFERWRVMLGADVLRAVVVAMMCPWFRPDLPWHWPWSFPSPSRVPTIRRW